MTESRIPPALADTARRFQELHAKGNLLVLPNAWDAASARIAVDAGAQAIATSSAAVSWALGAPDGNALSRELMVASLSRMVAGVDVPVSADIEAGFGRTDAEVAETVREVLAAGAVGVNLEDQTGGVFRSTAEQAALIAVVRAAADAAGVPLFINARTDTYLVGAGDFDETVERAGGYLAAGASGIFVPGVADLELIGRLVEAVDAPLNILVGPGSPSIPELAGVGVRRASAGSSIAAAIHGHTRRAAAELLGAGTYTELADPIPYPEMNALMS
ncbi:isocitrate lyase/PEP mutase family protein [Nakamurella lactea]|uniref:isocitrate lyase/PEP mutase family protein n=1 Tax=Nakamurella lactea TaxID=459515 RepID=UPI00040D378F|nr:isocitrate lyase/phosphoenolpyruvate mutase family protein [Nakamurella lactea]